MRPWLRWALLASVVMSIIALWWWPASPTGVHAALVPAVAAPDWTTPQPQAIAMARSSQAGATAPLLLPAQLPRALLETAINDPFVGVAPPAAPPLPAQAAPVTPAPPQVTAPPLNYRYLGRIVGPAGKPLVYLSRPDKDVEVSVGSRLEEGYVVDAIDEVSIKLLYPPLDVRVVIHIPGSETTR